MLHLHIHGSTISAACFFARAFSHLSRCCSRVTAFRAIHYILDCVLLTFLMFGEKKERQRERERENNSEKKTNAACAVR